MEKEFDKRSIKNDWIYLRVNVSAPNAECKFSYSEDGNVFNNIGESFIAKPDKWIGAKVGIFCNNPYEAKSGGYADFDWFRVTKN